MANNIDSFKEQGIYNVYRSRELIKQSIEFNKLCLENLVVFTEAASGNFIYTPIIAAMAGAKKVYAIAKDSKYGLKKDIKYNTLKYADFCGVENKIEIVFDKRKVEEAHIVTNLGFVRPIDKNTIDLMKKDAVIPYMCEAWEVRREDVDIEYCKAKGIVVMGTNENYDGLNVFNFSGPLAIKMLFDAGIEVYKSKIVIVSRDKFGTVIYDFISKVSSEVLLIKDINDNNKELLRNADALIIADYTSDECYIGKENAKISADGIRKLSSYVTVLQFAGKIDIEELKDKNIRFYPDYPVGSFRMGKTLAYLGPKPIIDLHCAGLKVGELMYYRKKLNKDQLLVFNSLCEKI